MEPLMPRLLQICNVGRIVGGTAACAWTVTRALAEWEHHVLFLSPPDRETVETFAPVPASFAAKSLAEPIATICPDAILLHNTSAERLPHKSAVPTVLYLHSQISSPASADITLCCSHWLARRMRRPPECALWQAVPKVYPAGRRDPASLVVGRLCTPQAKKWPHNILPIYAELAAKHPRIRWEFVGCPSELQSRLAAACRGRAVFHPAGWEQRAHLARWHALLYSNPAVPESFGRTAAEAMRAGCIPVVDRLGGFLEQVPTGCGFLCDSPADFDDALTNLADRDIRQVMSHRAEQHADEQFSLKRFAGRLRSVFGSLISENTTG
jgi:glycosyltransferase involved in cell wall biosynthesis